MARNSSSEGSSIALSEGRSLVALVGSLLLLGASFVLLVLAPQILARFHAASETVPTGGFLPIAAASGIALGGGAAMITVMARLVRDIEVRPYACLAPVLAVFSGYVMWGLRAQLPIESVSTEYAGVFALAVSVAGGSLVAQRGGARGIGWCLTLFAPLALLALIWASSGQTNFAGVVSGLTPQVKMYLGLLGASALALGAIGEGARVLARRARADRFVVPGGSASISYGSQAPIEDERLFEPPIDPEPPRYQPPPMRFDVKPAARPPRVNVWEFEDEELTSVPKKGLPWLTIVLSLLLTGGAGAAFYYGVFLPKQQKEDAAIAALKARQEQIKAAQSQEQAQKSAEESKAAAARLEAIVTDKPKAPEAAPAAAAPEKAAAPVVQKLPAPVAEPIKKPAAPAPQSAKAPLAAPAPKRAEPARKPGPADKLGEGNNDPIYGL